MRVRTGARWLVLAVVGLVASAGGFDAANPRAAVARGTAPVAGGAAPVSEPSSRVGAPVAPATVATTVVGSARLASPSASLLPFDRRVRRLASTDVATCAVFDDQSLRCFGDASMFGNAQVTSGVHETPLLVSGVGPAASVVMAGNAGCALRVSGTVRCWGTSSAVLHAADSAPHTFEVDGPTGVRDVAISVGHGCVVDGSSEVWCWGTNTSGETGPTSGRTTWEPPHPTGVRNARRVVVTNGSSCALLLDATTRCWGGTNPLNGRQSVVEAAVKDQQSGCLLELDGTVRCWGLLVPSTTLPLGAVRIAVPTSVDVGLGCALSDAGGLWCWSGAARRGPVGSDQLALSTRPALVPGLVASAFGGWCAIATDHWLRCWGTSNASGELGTFTTPSVAEPVRIDGYGETDPVRSIVGNWTGCITMVRGDVRCWGILDAVGLNSLAWSHEPRTVPGVFGAVREVGTVFGGGCAVTPSSVSCFGALSPLGGFGAVAADVDASRVVSIGGALRSICSSMDDASLRCWGRNTTLAPQPTDVRTGIRRVFSTAANDVWLSQSDGRIGTVNPPFPYRRVALDEDVAQVASSSAITCALLTTHRVRCWPAASNQSSQLPVLSPARLTDLVSVAVAPGSSDWTMAPACGVRAAGTVVCWDLAGVVTEQPRITDAAEIATIGDAYCVRTSGGELWCWGNGDWLPQRGYGFIDVPWVSANLRSAPVPGDG